LLGEVRPINDYSRIIPPYKESVVEDPEDEDKEEEHTRRGERGAKEEEVGRDRENITNLKEKSKTENTTGGRENARISEQTTKR